MTPGQTYTMLYELWLVKAAKRNELEAEMQLLLEAMRAIGEKMKKEEEV